MAKKNSGKQIGVKISPVASAAIHTSAKRISRGNVTALIEEIGDQMSRQLKRLPKSDERLSVRVELVPISDQ